MSRDYSCRIDLKSSRVAPLKVLFVDLNYKIIIEDFRQQRKEKVRVVVAELASEHKEWDFVDGLYFLNGSSRFREYIELFLSAAALQAADVLIFPELSVPPVILDQLKEWSRAKRAIIIAGSHYFRTEVGYVNRCPIIINGSIFFTEKAFPAPLETSPIANQSLQPGSIVRFFKNTIIGNFATLICSDYLNQVLRNSILNDPNNELDILFVPALQRRSDHYHRRMELDCEESKQGVYIIYCNMLCDSVGDGKSAIFGIMDRAFASKLVAASLIANEDTRKLVELPPASDYIVADLHIKQKRPFAGKTIYSRSNVEIVEIGKLQDGNIANASRAETQTPHSQIISMLNTPELWSSNENGTKFECSFSSALQINVCLQPNWPITARWATIALGHDCCKAIVELQVDKRVTKFDFVRSLTGKYLPIPADDNGCLVICELEDRVAEILNYPIIGCHYRNLKSTANISTI